MEKTDPNETQIYDVSDGEPKLLEISDLVGKEFRRLKIVEKIIGRMGES